MIKDSSDVNFFTVATNFYRNFVPAYIYFVQQANPGCSVEILVNNFDQFMDEHGNAIRQLQEVGEIKIRPVPKLKVYPKIDNTLRFILEPELKKKYTYIGDIDIMILDNALEAHSVIFEKGYSYSNIVRDGTQKLSGLHFTLTKDQFPLPNMNKLIKKYEIDEDLLYALVVKQGRLNHQFPKNFRPILGIHLSLNRLPFGGPERPGYELDLFRLKKLSRLVVSKSFSEFYEVSSLNSKIVLNTIIALSELSMSLGSTNIPAWKNYISELKFD